VTVVSPELGRLFASPEYEAVMVNVPEDVSVYVTSQV
jgi:hypothetical protein